MSRLVDRLIAELDAAARDAYLRFQGWDLINLALFGTTGVLVLGWLLRAVGVAETAWKWLLLFPVAVMAFDLLENAVLALAIRAFPDFAVSSTALPWLTGAKFAGVMSMFGSILGLGGAAIIKKLRR